MDFNLTEEQIAFQNSVRSLADKYLKEGNLIIPHIMPIRVLEGKRNKIRDGLIEAGVEVGFHYRPNHFHKLFNLDNFTLPKTEQLYSELLTLPMHPDLSEEDVKNVVSIMEKLLS